MVAKIGLPFSRFFLELSGNAFARTDSKIVLHAFVRSKTQSDTAKPQRQTRHWFTVEQTTITIAFIAIAAHHSHTSLPTVRSKEKLKKSHRYRNRTRNNKGCQVKPVISKSFR